MAKSPIALNNTGNKIPAGSAVFVSGFDPITNQPTIALADCRSAATMPAIGVVDQDVATGTSANVKASSVISYDTSLGTINGGVWVGFSGALTFTNPLTISSSYIAQQMGLVYTAGDLTTGTINLIVLAIQQNTQSGSQAVVVSAPAASDVTSVFGRTAAVVAVTNDYTWAQINKTTSDIADITTKSHTSLTDIGTNTHPQIDSALSRLVNTSGTNTGDQTVFGRSGNVSVASGDYTFDQLNFTGSSLNRILTKSHTQLSDIGTNTHAQIDTALTRLANTSGTNTGNQSMETLTDVTGAPSKNSVPVYNGTTWTFVPYNTNYTFSIASFSCNAGGNGSVIQIGNTNPWEAVGALSFSATYNNGPATGGYVSNGSWSNLTLGNTYQGPTVSTQVVNYPSVGGSVGFTLNATDGANPTTNTITYYFYNDNYYGVLTKSSGYTSADVTGLTAFLTNSRASSWTVNPASTYYIIFALPVRLGTPTFTVGGFSGGFTYYETVTVTNTPGGYAESYYVYRSDNSGLGSTTVIVS